MCWEKLVIPKPNHLTWAEAASIPENFLTGADFIPHRISLRLVDTLASAFQCLVLCSGLKEDDDVLIHAGASGVGIAAIQISRVKGA